MAILHCTDFPHLAFRKQGLKQLFIHTPVVQVLEKRLMSYQHQGFKSFNSSLNYLPFYFPKHIFKKKVKVLIINFAHCLGSIEDHQISTYPVFIFKFWCHLSHNIHEEWFWALIISGSLSVSGFCLLMHKQNVPVFITFGMLVWVIFLIFPFDVLSEICACLQVSLHSILTICSLSRLHNNPLYPCPWASGTGVV
jgi:hypothetical protein